MTAGGVPTSADKASRDGLDGGHVGGDVLAGAAVSPGGRLHVASVPVGERHGQPVDLQFAFERGSCGDALGQPVGPRLELLGREGVVQAHHGDPVFDGGELGRGAAPPTGSVSGNGQVGVVGLDVAQLPDQGVVLGVGDLRIILLVVALVVVLDEPPELVGPGRRVDISGG